MTEIYTIGREQPARPMTREEAIAALRRARAKYDGKIDKSALDQFERMATINALMLRAGRIRLRAVAANDRRKHKRADRLMRQALALWHRGIAGNFKSIGEALRDIVQASHSAIAAIKMLGAGMQIAFKPKVTTDDR